MNNQTPKNSSKIGTKSKFYKRSVRNDSVRWVGEGRFMYLYRKCPSYLHELIYELLFLTGCRATEALSIRPDQIAWNDTTLSFFNLIVLKKPRLVTRDMNIGRHTTLLANEFIKKISKIKTPFVLASRRFKDKPMGYSTLYEKVLEIDKSIWPHWFRGQRAGYLVEVKGYDIQEIQHTWRWSRLEMAAHYTATGDRTINKKEGIEDIPKPRFSVEV